MTIPPDRISVKRRRDDDPVEALYIQSKKYRPNTIWTLQCIDHVCIPNSQQTASLLEQSKSVGAGPPGRILSTSSTPWRGTDASPRRSKRSLSLQGVQEGPTKQSDTASLAAPKPPVAKSTSGPCDLGGTPSTIQARLRRFHLSHDSFPTLIRRVSFTHGIRKHRKPQRDSLALFVERDSGHRTLKNSIRVQELKYADVVEGPDTHNTAEPEYVDTSTRKRPNAGAAEKAWRAETWGERKGIATKDEHQVLRQSPTNWDPASISLAEELHLFAVEESEAQAKNAHIPPNAQLKFKPKAPKPRNAEVDTNVKMSNTDVVAHGDIDEDDDYIVDTYIKSSLPSMETDLSLVNPLQALDSNKIGILVIEEEQEGLWETYAHDRLSEAEVESEEEDENAEDFHGNDYPEDEADAEDEYGRSSHKFHNSASDDNEYDDDDDDEPQWSDGEDPLI